MISNRTYGIDPDVLAYNARIVAGGNQSLSMQSIRDLNQFVISLKKMNLWASMVCWPFRAQHNAGLGTTAYSLGGLGIFNGTLTNGPTWGVDGISFGSNTQYIEYSPQFSIDFTKGGYSIHAVWSALGIAISSGEGAFNLFSSSDSNLQNVLTTGVGGGATWLSQSRNYNNNRYFQNIGGDQPISGNVGYGWNADMLRLQLNGVDITTSSVGSSTPSNGLRTVRTTGRNNTNAAATSRVSYLMAFSSNIGMTTAQMTNIYILAKQTIGQGLNLP